MPWALPALAGSASVAAKGKAPGKAAARKAKPKKSQAAKTSVKKRTGPRLTAAQWKAYRAAANRVMRRQAAARSSRQFIAQAEALRKRRLATAARVTSKQKIAYAASSQAAVRKFAVMQTFRQVAGGHQAAYRRTTAARRVFSATMLATQRLFIHQGIAIHAHRNRMQTLTSGQAQAFIRAARQRSSQRLKNPAVQKKMQQQRANARRTARARSQAAKRANPLKGGYSPQAKAAGLAAASAAGGGIRSSRSASVAKGKRKQARAKARSQASQRRRATQRATGRAQSQYAKSRNLAQSQARGSQSAAKAYAKPIRRKAAVITPVVNADWIAAGNNQGTENCVAVAIANHLLAWTGYRLTDDQVSDLHEAGDGTIRGTLLAAAVLWRNIRVALAVKLSCLSSLYPTGTLLGTSTSRGPHAVLLMPGNQVVSWGELTPLEDVTEEAWYVQWELTTSCKQP